HSTRSRVGEPPRRANRPLGGAIAALPAPWNTELSRLRTSLQEMARSVRSCPARSPWLRRPLFFAIAQTRWWLGETLTRHQHSQRHLDQRLLRPSRTRAGEKGWAFGHADDEDRTARIQEDAGN